MEVTIEAWCFGEGEAYTRGKKAHLDPSVENEQIAASPDNISCALDAAAPNRIDTAQRFSEIYPENSRADPKRYCRNVLLVCELGGEFVEVAKHLIY